MPLSASIVRCIQDWGGATSRMRSGNIRQSKPSNKTMAHPVATQLSPLLVAERKRAAASCPTSFVRVEADYFDRRIARGDYIR